MPVRLASGRARRASSTEPDWVLAGDEYNGDRLCCRLGRQSHIITGRGNHADLAANQFGSEFRQPIALIFGEAVYDRHILTLDMASLLQALPVCTQASESDTPDGRARNPTPAVAGCCARAASAHATAVPPGGGMKSRRFMRAPPPPRRRGAPSQRLPAGNRRVF